MSYTPTEWESADIVTATRINRLETAVGDMNMSYTPNTWSDGDILSAEKMNALEQAVASGGGGSSDFSTAEVTTNTNSISGAFANQLPQGAPMDYASMSRNAYSNTLILYKGYAIIQVADTVTSTSGSIQELGGGSYIVTGDCSITVTTIS